MLTGCKASVSQFVTTLTHTCNIGFDGYIARLTTFAAASHGVSGMPCPHYRRHWTIPTNDRCERSTRPTGSLPTVSSSAFQWLPVRSVSKNSRSFSHLISRLDGFRNFTKIGAWKILQTNCCLLAPACFPLSTSRDSQSYNFRIPR